MRPPRYSSYSFYDNVNAPRYICEVQWLDNDTISKMDVTLPDLEKASALFEKLYNNREAMFA
jgi:hypothetical protein